MLLGALFVAGTLLAIFAALNSLTYRGPEPRGSSLGRVLSWSAAGSNLVWVLLLQADDVHAPVALFLIPALPTWVVLFRAPRLPRGRRIRLLPLAMLPMLLFPAMTMSHPTIHAYRAVAVFFAPTLVAVLVALLAPVPNAPGAAVARSGSAAD